MCTEYAPIFFNSVFEKPADSFKLAWSTLPDSFKIPRNPCQTVLIFFGFLFTPTLISRLLWRLICAAELDRNQPERLASSLFTLSFVHLQQKKWVTRSLVSIAQSNNYQGFFEAADNLIGSKSVLRTSADECMCWFSPQLTPYQTLQLNGQISLLDGVSLKGIHASMYTYRWWLIMINLLLFNCVNLHSHPGLPETCGRLYAIEYF